MPCWKSEMLGKGAGGDLDKVEIEDQEIVEATQRVFIKIVR